jgi:nitronate monooxygenase
LRASLAPGESRPGTSLRGAKIGHLQKEVAVILDELRYPLVQAPMAGGPSTVELAVAVTKAGGLGFVAAGYRSAEEMLADVRAVRAGTSGAFGVNLLVPGGPAPDEDAVRLYLERLRVEAHRYGVALGEPRAGDDEWDEKLRLLHVEAVPVVSFTFGCPAAEVVRSLRRVGSEVWVTVTDPDEARTAAAAGAEVLVMQGFEAGGHQGSFVDRDAARSLSVLSLIRLAAGLGLPLVAAGGITDGAAVAAVLAAGARAAQMGSAFLRCPEAGTGPAHRRALASGEPTALTRAFTGRMARSIVNRFMLEHDSDAPAAYPQIHHATSPLRAAARERGDTGGFNLWAGQTYALAAEEPAGDVVQRVAAEAETALRQGLSHLGGPPG